MIKRLLIAIMLMMLTGVVSAQEDANLIPNELYFQTAMLGEWQAIDTENGILILSGVNPRLQYTMTTPRLWSVELENAPFIETWGSLTDIAPLEAILSFGEYNIRLLLSAPAYYTFDDTVQYQAQVVEVINFLDETSKEIPSFLFRMPTLTIQPTLDFTLALMDAATTRLDGTRNADCGILYDNYRGAQMSYLEGLLSRPRIDATELANRQLKMAMAYQAFFYACLNTGDEVGIGTQTP